MVPSSAVDFYTLCRRRNPGRMLAQDNNATRCATGGPKACPSNVTITVIVIPRTADATRIPLLYPYIHPRLRFQPPGAVCNRRRRQKVRL